MHSRFWVVLGAAAAGLFQTGLTAQAFQPVPAIHTVFIVTMENIRWSEVQGSASAPFINQTLLPSASYATQYYGAPNIHPSLPNYLWLEEGSNFGILNDDLPSQIPQTTTQHLATALQSGGFSWAAWVENISAGSCPTNVSSDGLYTPAVNPTVYFPDVTSNTANCIAHQHPFSQLQGALNAGTAANLNWIVPNLCDDGHSCTLGTADAWLATVIPMIQASKAYQNGGCIFVLWDEVDTPYANVPVGMMVLSPSAKGGGYNNSINYTHASTLRTIEEIFGLTPFFGNAASATDLSDLFNTGSVAVSPMALTFAPEPLGGRSSSQSVTLFNHQSVALALSGVDIAGDFSQSNDCGAELAPGAQCPIAVTYTPTQVGNESGSLTITTGDAGSPRVIALSGQGEAGIATLSASALSFGMQTVGTTSAPQPITVTNTGAATISFNWIASSGPFPEVNTCGQSLAPEASCAIRTSFTPTAPVAASGLLELSDDAPGSPQKITLSGTGQGAIAVISTEVLNFGSQADGSTTATHAFTIQNSGNIPLGLAAVKLTGPFTETNSCGGAIAAGVSCTFAIGFAPQSPGNVNGEILFTDNAPDSPQEVVLTGQGTGPTAVVSAPSVDFSPQPVATPAAAQTVTVQNSGNAALDFSAITVTGPFTESDNCVPALAANAHCSIQVVFMPVAAGNASGTLNLDDNVPGSPQNIALTGSGLAPAAALSAATVNFGSVLVGAPAAAQTITLKNTGNAPLTVSAVTATGDFSATNSCTLPVAPGAGCEAAITFVPTQASARSGAISFLDNAGTQNVALEGNGLDLELSSAGGNALTAAANGTASVQVLLTPINGLTDPGVTVTCQSVPILNVCSVSPATTAIAGAAPVPVQVILSAAGTSNGAGASPATPRAPLTAPESSFAWLTLAVLGIALACTPRGRRAFVSLSMLLLFAACGGAPTPPPPPPLVAAGAYQVKIVATTTSGAVRTLDLTLTVQ